MKVYGLTGGIASGKSVLERMLSESYPVIDADIVSREVVAPGSRGLARVAEVFGSKVLQADGSLDRAVLRNIIAHSEEDQQRLNGILHPLIGNAIMATLNKLAEVGHETAFVSAALMLESGSYKRYDGVILVCSPEETRLARLLQRDDMDETSAKALMARQMPDSEKRKLATVVIENDSDFTELRKRLVKALVSLGVS
ncbi:MAG: dephospho-CoA kinase [Acidobacteriota bacterium]|nr:dephospho-CoA kinase [Acidobacteriota bacterium]